MLITATVGGHSRGQHTGLYEARGRGGQTVTIAPARDTIVVFTGGFYDREQLAKLLFAAIKADEPIAENPTAQAQLERSLTAATQAPAPLPVPSLPELAREISGQVYRFSANPLGFETLALNFDQADTAMLTLVSRAGRFVMPVGLDAVYRFTEITPSDQAAGLKGVWRSPHEFVLRYDEIAGPGNYILYLDFDGSAINVRLDDPTGLLGFTTRIQHKAH